MKKIKSCIMNKRVSKKRKRVSFHRSTKTHDGLAPAQEHLQRLVSNYYQPKPTLDLLVQMLHHQRDGELRTLLVNLRNAIFRVAQSANGKAPLLQKGGGSGVVLRRANLPRLKRLFHATEKVYKECLRCKT